MQSVLAVAIAATALVGCTSQSPDGTQVAETDSSGAPSVSPTPYTATVGDYSVLFLPAQKRISRATDDVNDCRYRFSVVAGIVDCQAAPASLRAEVRIFLTSLAGAEALGSPRYVGPPPSQVSDLVDEARRAARHVLEATASWSQSECTFGTTHRCRVLYVNVANAADDLLVSLYQWS